MAVADGSDPGRHPSRTSAAHIASTGHPQLYLGSSRGNRRGLGYDGGSGNSSAQLSEQHKEELLRSNRLAHNSGTRSRPHFVNMKARIQGAHPTHLSEYVASDKLKPGEWLCDNVACPNPHNFA